MTVNWKKTKIQFLSNFLPPVPDLTVSGEQVEPVMTFTDLCTSIITSCCSHPEISRRLDRARAAMRDLNRILGPVWHFKRRYDSTTSASNPLPIAQYASENLTLTQHDSGRINTFAQWFLKLICRVYWSDHITNMEILHRTY